LPILFDEERCVWALQSNASTYGLGVDGEGRLQHLYHGAALLRLDDLPQSGPPSPAQHFEPPGGPEVRYEYPAWGGIFYGEPCLKVTFSDGVRDVRLIYEGHEVRDGAAPELTVELRDTHYPLRASLHYRLFEEQDVVARYAVLKNEGEDPIMLEEVLSAAWYVPRGYGYQLTHLAGRFAGETQVYREEISPGKKVLESRRGVTSHHANPCLPWTVATPPRTRARYGSGRLCGAATGRSPSNTMPTATSRSPAASTTSTSPGVSTGGRSSAPRPSSAATREKASAEPAAISTATS
jgi:alpha-galactosidase